MFGYLNIFKDELKVKHLREHQNIYCSLCYIIRTKYGLPYAAFLRYEPVFLYFLLDQENEKKNKLKYRCPLNPLRTIECEVNYGLLEYAAFINMMLVVHKCQDDYIDSKNRLRNLVGSLLTKNKSFHIETVAHYDMLYELGSILDKFYAGEKKMVSIDESMHYMGDYLSGIVNHYFEFYTDVRQPIDKSTIICISSEIGKWVYAIDAVDDYEKDLKKGDYNPINQIKSNDQQKAALIILGLIQTKTLKLLSSTHLYHADIIENYIKYGCANSIKMILKKKEKNQSRRNMLYLYFSQFRIR